MMARESPGQGGGCGAGGAAAVRKPEAGWDRGEREEVDPAGRPRSTRCGGIPDLQATASEPRLTRVAPVSPMGKPRLAAAE